MGTTTADTARHAALGRSEPGASRVDPHRPLPAPREDCPPRCPSCGGLECLCRPRFFPGQLLTDEALNRLDQYVVAKNKLHNRYLHGWGVVCGLEVTCDPCSPSLVRVRSGYALAPCGEDIVLCRDEQVNVCDLVNRCRDDRSPICDDPWKPPPLDCPDVLERWVLAVCYDERPSRGITPVTPDTDNACCTKCACGGAGSCGCGGAAAAKAEASTAGALAGAAAPHRRGRRHPPRRHDPGSPSASRRSSAKAIASRHTRPRRSRRGRRRRRSTTATTSSRSVPLSSPRCRINGVLSSPG